MNRPSFILFDYGQTLIREKTFSGLAGYEALLAHAAHNPRGLTARQVGEEAEAMREEMGHNSPQKRLDMPVEVHHHLFQDFLCEYLDIKLDIDKYEIERVFWDAAAPGGPAPGIQELLHWLHAQGIRTAVVSNLTFSSKTLRRRLNALLPRHHFEFVLTSSEAVFRKPSRYIFGLALQKARIDAQQAWFCGDNFAADITGAHRAGLWPVWYRDAQPPADAAFPFLHIRHWHELRRELETRD